MPENCQAVSHEDGHLLIALPDTLMKGEQDRTQEFENWRTTIPMAQAKDKKPQQVLADRPVSMTGIMKKVMEYNVLEHSPIECMQFVTDIQKQLVGIL